VKTNRTRVEFIVDSMVGDMLECMISNSPFFTSYEKVQMPIVDGL